MRKWWGWGNPKQVFLMTEKPNLWPWIKATLGIEKEIPAFPIPRGRIELRIPRKNQKFLELLSNVLSEDQIQFDDDDRLNHTYGKSFPDLFRARNGVIKAPPDCIIYPDSHEQVVAVVRAAQKANVCIIPFGGGTNIVGCVEPQGTEERMIATLDLMRMHRILSIDEESHMATLEAGAIGPQLEADLQSKGWSLGHYPDSFEYSTLGGWIATRSAGMQSDAYGRIEDLMVSVKMVTPKGEIRTKTTPASSVGPDINRIVLGSEGTLGVITEATMRVHRTPAVKDYRGFLFKSIEDGMHAIHECYKDNCVPSMFRLQDSWESQLGMQMKAPKKGFNHWFQSQVKKILVRRGYQAPCIAIVGFEGSVENTKHIRPRVLKIMKKYSAFPLGKGVGNTWSVDKFNIPYLRDYLMDYSCTADVAETSTVWSNLMPLYHNAIREMKAKFARDGIKGYIGCHLSHSYQTGACLYFTWAMHNKPTKELETYYDYKRFVTETFLKNNGSLSHHHAIGYEHLPWMREEVTPAGVLALNGLKRSLDPQNICNPGKLIPEDREAKSELDSRASELEPTLPS